MTVIVLFLYLASFSVAFLTTFTLLSSTSSLPKGMAVKIADYGTWKSPISSDLIAKGGVKLSHDIDVDNEGRVFWAELRSTEGGRSVICSWKEGEEKPTQWTPEGFNARTKSNEYGGGAFFVSADGVLYFSNYKDQRLYRQRKPDSTPEPVTEDKAAKYMYADGHFAPSLGKIITVREDHTQENVESKTTIVSIDPETQEQHILVTGADFYLSPSISSDGKKIAWVEYNHPNMPWDSTKIFLANLDSNGTAILNDTKTKVAGADNNSVILPKFSPEGELFYIDDRSNFWNLHHYHQQSGEVKNIVPKEFEIGGPQWVFGIDGFVFGPKGSNEIYGYFDNDLGVVNTKTLELKTIPTTNLRVVASGSSDIIPTQTIVSSPQGQLFLVAGSTSQAASLFKLDPTTLKVKTIVRTSVDIETGYISIPEKISFPTSDNATAYGYLYLPKNKDYSAPSGQLPPLIVRAHSGPTSGASIVLNLKHQFLTSRGIAVLDVDYRGSTGYGRNYRDALKGTWGIYDVDDVTNGALYLVKSSKVNGNCLSIDGGSAGGYTTLAALTFKSVFQAGISLYGVSDLEALVLDTHKFESRYLDSLIGPYPEAKQIYMDRSPIYHTEKLNSSIAFFQGDEDKVVPPSQAENMFRVVKEKGFKTAYVLFPGEQHGFKDAKNIKRCIDGELYFLSKVFEFAVPDIDVEIEIFNL